MPISRKRELASEPDAYWYENERHKNQARNQMLFDSPGWFWCDADSFYRSLFPEGSLQEKGADADGKPNIIVLEDTGQEIDQGTDDKGNKLVKRVMHRYTVHDDLDELEHLRNLSLEKNTFMFLAPVSYYGKSRSSRNARFLHAIMIDLDYVGERQLANLLHQMERGVIPYANYLVSSGTGLHVVYKLDHPVPLMTRYVAGLQALKRELTDRVWNANTSDSDPDKKQSQGIFQGFRMVGTATKLNGALGNPKYQQPYVVECFSHDETPPATIPYLLSFVPKLRDKEEMDSLDALQALTQEMRSTTPIDAAKEKWPEWYEKHVVNGEPRGGWTFGRAGYDRVLRVIKEQVSVSHRYWCIFYLAVMANKCGVSQDELEDDAYGLLERFDALSVEPGNRFTANDVAAALEAYEGGSASGRARRYTQAFCERKAAVEYGEKMGHGSNPPEKRLPKDLTLKKARMSQALKHEANGTTWRNHDGAPKKAMQVWQAAAENPDFNVSALARIAGVSRPTVYKWLAVPDWRECYKAGTVDASPVEDEASEIVFEDDEEREMWERWDSYEREWLSPGGGFEEEVLEAVAAYPWKCYEEIAIMFGIADGDSVRRTVEENRELFDQIKLRAGEEGV